MSTKETIKEKAKEHRTRRGCLTCRKRRVKCDEKKPKCANCTKGDRTCVYDDSLKFKEYPYDADDTPSERPPTDFKFVSEDPSRARTTPKMTSGTSEEAQGGPSTSVVSPRSTPLAPIYPYTNSNFLGIEEATGVLSSSSLLPHDTAHAFSAPVVSPTVHEGELIHYFTEKLGRWLDCGHLIRHFTLGIPEKLKSCSVLHRAVLLFADRHKSDRSSNAVADGLRPRYLYDLGQTMSKGDENLDDLLCTQLVLHFFEQLNASHMQTLKSLHKASSVVDHCMGPLVDSSAPTFRIAAFWLYVRQWISSVICYEQQLSGERPPDMDFSRQLYIDPTLSNNLVKWSNEITWHTAQVVAFCSSNYNQNADDRSRAARWEELWNGIGLLWNDRPPSMEPLFEEQRNDETSSSRVWFQAEWHATGFGFHHLASMLLLSHLNRQAFTDSKRRVLLGGNAPMLILGLGRKLYGASKCNPEYAPLAMILCNSVLIWFELIPSNEERNEVVRQLESIEITHLWPTAWIIERVGWSLSDLIVM